MPVSSYQNRLSSEVNRPEGADDVSARCRDFTQQFVHDHPVASTLGVFGIGLGVGAVIGALIADRQDSHSRRQAEVIGRRMLASIRDVLPENVRSYIS